MRGKCADLTRRWALRESFPPTEVTLQVYVPMSPDHVWEMCKVPSGSRRRRGDVFTSITEPLFSHTYLEVCARIYECYSCTAHTLTRFTPQRFDSKSVCLMSHQTKKVLTLMKSLVKQITKWFECKNISLCCIYSGGAIIRTFSSLSHIHHHIWSFIHMHSVTHILAAPVINCNYSGSAANLLSVAFN